MLLQPNSNHKIGIVGSSYSMGSQLYNNPYYEEETLNKLRTKALLPIFQKISYEEYDNGEEFFSMAKSGQGTEQYLSHIIFLKKKYSINILLLEIVENREDRLLKHEDNFYKKCMKLKSADVLFDTIYEYDINYEGSYTSDTGLLPLKRYNFFSWKDIITSIELCKLLNIKLILWCYNSIFDLGEYHKKFLTNCNIIYFGKQFYAKEYFIRKHRAHDKIFCDRDHLSDEQNEELVRDFLLPAIHKEIHD